MATNREMLQWCEIVEQEIDKELDSKYIEYSKQLGDRREECLILLHQVSNICIISISLYFSIKYLLY